ncbi:hypothetical protein CA606_18585 [Caulobacter vibrioides]|uniref:Uncharacterized protein n=1 Tax=Caulobacter vibrioides TaxID=155892 RepID=A0A290MQ47_CAUVI|nr:hypothetical protein [Caulobacter vibrioides]ATC34178.1 hypothetical protein CA606_18585 [Caulobacter vibrioides]
MSHLPVIMICTAAAQTNINRVWEAMGRGPGTFSRKLTTAPAPTTESPATHYLSSDASTDQATVAVWQGFAGGDLPPLPEGVVWGENGVISAADAMAAITGANLQIYSASGDVEPIDHANGVLLGRGLKWVPEPEV